MLEFNKYGVNYKFVDTSVPTIHNWLRDNFDRWEPFTFEVFQRVAKKDKIAVDIGAWIGLTPIWLCKHFDSVLCVEGDMKSKISLEANLKASDCSNYTIFPYPIYKERGRFYFGPNNFLQGACLNDSTSQLKEKWTHPDDYVIDTITLKDIITEPEKVGFIKVDIEGGEEDILEELYSFCEKYKIPMLLSFHTYWWKNINLSRFAHLFKKGIHYSDNFHVENDVLSYLDRNRMGTLFIEW